LIFFPSPTGASVPRPTALSFAVAGVPHLHASQLAHQHTPPSGLMTNGKKPQHTSKK